MEGLLKELVISGEVEAVAEWMKKQATRQLLSVLNTQEISEIPGLFALAKWITEPSIGTISSDFQTFMDYVVQRYVEAGCYIDQVTDELPPGGRRSRKGFTPLLFAVEQRKTCLVKALLNSGADPNLSDACGYSPLHWAVLASSSVDTVKDLIAAGADIYKFIPLKVHPVFHLAIDEGRLEIVHYFLETGMNVNLAAPYMVLPEESWEELKSRYDCGFLTNRQVQKDISAIGRAVRMRKLKVLEILLREPNAKVTLDELNFCILEGDSEVANIILKHMDISILASHKINGKWALHWLKDTAFFNAYQHIKESFEPARHTKKLIATYISAGWNVNAFSDFSSRHDSYRSTILLRSIELSSELVSFLLKNGADPYLSLSVIEVPGIDSPTALHAAILLERFSVIKVFDDAGVDFSQRFGPLPHSISSKFYIPQSLTCFEKLLTVESKDKELSYLITSHLAKGKTKVEKIHLVLAMIGGNVDIVLQVLLSLPIDVSLEGLVMTREKIPALQWFVTSVLKQDEGYEDAIFYNLVYYGVQIQTINEIIKRFSSREYNVNAFKRVLDFEKPLVCIALNRMNNQTRRNNMEIFECLRQLPKIDWNQHGERGLPPLWIAIFPILTIRCYRLGNSMECVEVVNLRLKVIDNLLSAGVRATDVTIDSFFKHHLCLVHILPILKKLWWAGAEIKMQSDKVDDFYAKAEQHFHQDTEGKQRLTELRNWLKVVTSKKGLRLERLAAVAVRRSMKFTDWELMQSDICPTSQLQRIVTVFNENMMSSS